MANHRKSMLLALLPVLCLLLLTWPQSSCGLELPQAIPPGSHPGPVDGVPQSIRVLAFYITGKLISFIFTFLFLVILYCSGAGFPVLGRRRRDVADGNVSIADHVSLLWSDVMGGEAGLRLARAVDEAVMAAVQRWS